MAEVKDKVVTVESLKAKHDYDESTYLKKSGALTTLGVTATAAELNKMDGVTATTTELNYVDGVTSNIQTQLNNKLPLSGGTITGDVSIVRGDGDYLSMSVSVNEENNEIEIVDSNGSSVLIPCSVENNVALGFDGWKYGEKGTNIYGNSIKMWSNEAGLTGREYGVNKVLWNNAYFMTANHVVNLSESVSAQPNGIVLIFSKYADSVVQDDNFCSFFVPKWQIANHSGKGMVFMMVDSTGDFMARKYLFISDTKITGHDNNNKTATTACGITWKNSNFVLRSVIGV